VFADFIASANALDNHSVLEPDRAAHTSTRA
jgi:hypothetical protein